ncbi:MAG: 4Fe-4S binding protein [Candidatus Methanofastidiosia archaeon]
MPINVIVDEEKCNGCGECIDSCPSEVFEMVNEKAKPVRIEDCTACMLCETQCEAEAITVEED